MLTFHLKNQLTSNIEKRNLYLEDIKRINDGCEVNINMDLLKELCDRNKNRATNLFGYWMISSCLVTKVAIKLIEKYNNKAYRIITNYLLDDNVCHTNFYTLLINNFKDLFEIEK